MQKVSELTSPPVVGKFYLVPCVEINGYGRAQVPVIPHWHSDAELGVPQSHYHLDIRFLPAFLNTHARHTLTARRFGHLAAMLGAVAVDQSIVWPTPVILSIDSKKDPVLRRRKCRFELPEFPNVRFIRDKLQPKFIGRKVLCGRCPHKGMPLESLPQDENGHVICTGHGLRIDMNKREVVER